MLKGQFHSLRLKPENLQMNHVLKQLAIFMAGGAVGFYSGNIKFANNDMKALKPTILPAVPKFLNRIYDDCVAVANKVKEKK